MHAYKQHIYSSVIAACRESIKEEQKIMYIYIYMYPLRITRMKGTVSQVTSMTILNTKDQDYTCIYEEKDSVCLLPSIQVF